MTEATQTMSVVLIELGQARELAQSEWSEYFLDKMMQPGQNLKTRQSTNTMALHDNTISIVLYPDQLLSKILLPGWPAATYQLFINGQLVQTASPQLGDKFIYHFDFQNRKSTTLSCIMHATRNTAHLNTMQCDDIRIKARLPGLFTKNQTVTYVTATGDCIDEIINPMFHYPINDYIESIPCVIHRIDFLVPALNSLLIKEKYQLIYRKDMDTPVKTLILINKDANRNMSYGAIFGTNDESLSYTETIMEISNLKFPQPFGVPY